MKHIALFLITIYQKGISPLLHQILGAQTACRMQPTCSEYAKSVIAEYGIMRGFVLALRRLINCQPFFTI